MNTKLMLAISSCRVCVSAALAFIAPARAADPAPNTSGAPPLGEFVGQGAAGTDTSFDLRNGEAANFVIGGQATHGRLLVFSDGSLFRAYWQPQGSEEEYALANAGPNSVRLISTPPQGTPARDVKPDAMLQSLVVLSSPKL